MYSNEGLERFYFQYQEITGARTMRIGFWQELLGLQANVKFKAN